MTAPGGRSYKCCSDNRGSTAVEFAIVAPVVVMFLVGIMNLAFMLYSIGGMHFAVEDAARCASARPTVCNTSNAIIAFAATRYFGALVAPVFTHTVAACGNKVNATIAYTFDVGLFQQSVPLSATSCFP